MVRKLLLLSLTLLLVLTGTAVYAKDANSESVKNGNIYWPENQALPTFAEAKHLDVLDLRDNTGDEKLLFTTLQGNVNREKLRIYSIEVNYEEGNYTWLNDLNVPYTMIEDPWEIILKYKNDISGIIIYDPEVEDSINVATTKAGLENAVVASPELAEKLTNAPYNLKVIEDFRGRFKDGLDAYKWQFENLWPETTHRMLIGLNPSKSVALPDDNWNDFRTIIEEDEQIRDSSNRDVYESDLSEFLGEEAVYLRFQDAFTNDGWGPAIHEVTVKADGKIIAQFIPGTAEEEPFLYDRNNSSSDERFGGHRWADNGNYFVYQFDPPEGTQELTVSIDMWNQFKVSASNVQPLSSEVTEPYGYLRDYAVANKAMVFWLESNDPEEKELFESILSDVEPNTPYLGWFGNDVAGEFSSTEITSRHSVYVLAADWFNNMTVFSGTKGKMKKQKPLPAPELDNKIYVTFTLGEGDNLQYNQHKLRQLWDDEARGSVPINWSTTPLLYDAAPIMLSHYQQTATENDLLVVGPSGAGYIYPTPWPDETFSTFAEQTNKYMKLTGMDIIYALNRVDEQNVPLSETEAQDYIDYINPKGIFMSWENNTGTSILNRKLPQSILRGAGSVVEAKEAIAQAAAEWDGTSPLFISMGMLSWSVTPSDIKEIADSLGEEYEVVRGDQYFELLREANGLPSK
ncbi:GxGYxYP domain-containing protein [uncultured Metabacillus sp.]|uniref:GxGYxYP domain-containing protein n=1 Tax=uncultured Metabacillus sp. TaxID=2860135 RepID=UPI002631623D|nr:GxGYxYP domain-containing protein [uncultured Metabacillus sp.]